MLLCCLIANVCLYCVSIPPNKYLCVSANVVGDLERCRRNLLNVFQLDALGQFHQCHTTIHSVNVEDGEIRNDSADTTNSGLGQAAFGDDLGVAVLVQVVGHDDDLRGVVR